MASRASLLHHTCHSVLLFSLRERAISSAFLNGKNFWRAPAPLPAIVRVGSACIRRDGKGSTLRVCAPCTSVFASSSSVACGFAGGSHHFWTVSFVQKKVVAFALGILGFSPQTTVVSLFLTLIYAFLNAPPHFTYVFHFTGNVFSPGKQPVAPLELIFAFFYGIYCRGFHIQKLPSLKTVQQSHRYSKPFASPCKMVNAIEKGKYELQWCYEADPAMHLHFVFVTQLFSETS